LQLPARGNAAAFGAIAVVVRHSSPILLPAKLHNALLRGKVIARIATHANGSRTNGRPKPAFASCSRCSDLDLAGDPGEFICFNFRAAFTGGRRPALCAGLRPADLIFPLPRP